MTLAPASEQDVPAPPAADSAAVRRPRRRTTARRLVALDPATAWPLRAVAALAAVAGVARLGAIVLLARAVAALASRNPSLGAATVAGAVTFVTVSAVANAAARLVADRATGAATARLQDRVVAAAAARGAPADQTLTPLLAGGLDRLDGFVAGQWPTRARAVAVPLAATAVLLVVDWRAALVGLALLPAAPLLAWVIGARTAAQVRRTWRAAGRLGGTFLDSVAGVMTLKLYGRPEERAARIEAASEEHRRLTLGVLRTAVLSSAATGLVSTMAVGLVAVVCGTRVVSGSLGLTTALTAILLVPEVYRAPIEAASSFHTEAAVAAVLDDLEALLGPDVAAAPDRQCGELVLDAVTVTYPGREVAALPRFTGRFTPGTVTAVRGPSGCGKSTLLRVAAGLLPPTDGTVTRPARLGYLPQDPAFPHARTVRDAVRGGLADRTDDDLRAALQAAGAETVADEAYGGLDRPLEAFGTSLSTGERRLVALARAHAAADSPGSLMVLDEPTAHLDPDTERRVLDRLLTSARERGLVVVMAAHRPAALAAADRVVELAANVSAETSPVDDRAARPERADAPAETPTLPPAQSPTRGESGSARWLPAAAVACGVLSALCGLALTATATALLVRAADHPPLLALSLYIVSVRAFALGRPVLRYCERLLAHDAAFRALTRWRMQVWSLLVPRIPGRGLPASGDLLSRIARDVDDEVDASIRGVHAGQVLATTVVAAVVGLAVLAPTTAAVAGAGALAVVAGAWLVDRTAYARRSSDLQRQRAARDAAAVDVLLGLDDLVGNGGPAAAAAVTAVGGAELRTAARRVARLEAATDALVAVVTGLLPFAALAAALAGGARPSPVPTAAAVLVVAALAELLAAAPEVARAVRLRTEARARRLAIAEVPVTPGGATEAARVPQGADLVLRDVAASWGGTESPVLHGLSLDLPTGRRVAVTGSSGSGKSTLVAVAAHLLAPTAGEVRLGGVDYRTLDAVTVRRRVAVVGLADHVFAGTVRGNLTLGEPFTTGEVLDALDRVRLGGWLASLPDGLETQLGSGGTTLSGGEARRLALARGLLRRTAVLVLDEPVEGLDSPTAQAVLRDLSDRDPGLSWLLLAHRTEGLDLVDAVHHLENGRLVVTPAG